MRDSAACQWCERPFPARRGGSPQRFCCAGHRMAFWSALRRWSERAVAAGVLSLDQIRNGSAEACMLRPGGKARTTIHPAEKPVPVAPPESAGEFADEAADLLDGLLLALLDLPGDVWPDLAAALPDEIFDRIDRYVEARLT